LPSKEFVQYLGLFQVLPDKRHFYKNQAGDEDKKRSPKNKAGGFLGVLGLL
jgi:hypothetical protein